MQELTFEVNKEIVNELEEMIPDISAYILDNCVHFVTAAVAVQSLVDTIQDLKSKLGMEEE